MLKEINKYKLNNNVTIKKLLHHGFVRFNDYLLEKSILLSDKYHIWLNIRIILADGEISFNFSTENNITIIDEENDTSYIAFYKDKKFPILMEIIQKYNLVLNDLCEKKILERINDEPKKTLTL